MNEYEICYSRKVKLIIEDFYRRMKIQSKSYDQLMSNEK